MKKIRRLRNEDEHASNHRPGISALNSIRNLILYCMVSILFLSSCGSNPTVPPNKTDTYTPPLPTDTYTPPTPTDTEPPPPTDTYTPTPTEIVIPVTPGSIIPTPHKNISSIENEDELCDYLIWNLKENLEEETSRNEWSSVVDFSYISESNLLAFGTVNGSVGFYDFLSGNHSLKPYIAIDGDVLLRITRLRISDNNRFIYLSPYAAYIDKWGMEDYSLHKYINKLRLVGKDLKVLDFIFHDDLIYLATERGEFVIVDNNINRIVKEIAGSYTNNPINSIAITDDGKYLVSGGSGLYIRLWTLKEAPVYLNLKERIEISDGVNAVSTGTTDSGYIFVFGSDNGNLYITDDKFEDVYTISPGFDAIWSVAISQNSDLLAVGTQTGHLLIYDINEIINAQKGAYKDPQPFVYKISQFDEYIYSRINSLSFSIDNNYLAIGSLNFITVKGPCPPFSDN